MACVWIAANVYRRVIDAFAMFTYIGKLRKGAQSVGNIYSADNGGVDVKSAAKKLHKDSSFISAADIFNTLPKEQQEGTRPPRSPISP